MIRATAGTWANYATTLVFQVLFAASFGTSPAASAFVIAFAVSISASGIFVTTVLTVVLPRMLTDDGAISRRAANAIAAAVLAATAVGLALAAVALLAADAAAEVLATAPDDARALLLIAAALLVVLALAGVLGIVALARGHRFFPAVGPALPSTAGAVYLLIAPQPDVVGTLIAMTAGAAAQAIAMGYFAAVPTPHIIDTPPMRSRSLAIWTLLSLVALNALPPMQRILATSVENAGAAQFDYAARGLHVVLQLLVGGLVISSLPDWTTMRRRARHLRLDVTRATSFAALLLVVAGSVLLVAVTPVVALVLERGAFEVADTDAVALLVRLLLPGFVAEGLTLVMTQALLATKFTRIFWSIGFIRFAIQATLTVVLGVAMGAVGVAIAYTVSVVATASMTAIAAARVGMFRGGSALLWRTAAVASGVVVAAGGLLLIGEEWAWLSAAVIVVVALAGVALMDLGELIPQGIIKRLRPDVGGLT
jgi:putative peptidoglycan lipid II flippase